MSPALSKLGIAGSRKGWVKVLGVAASSRKKGNSEILLDRVLEGASSKGARTEKVILNKLNIRPCQGEGRCDKDGVCFIRDDMAPLYKKLKTADAIVVASPVYFGSVSAQLKIVIDRCQSLWVESFILKKRNPRLKRKGIFISVSGSSRKRFFRNSKEIVEIFFKVLGVGLFKQIYVPNLEHAGEVLKKRLILDKAFRYGESLIDSSPSAPVPAQHKRSG